jgi:3-deoxy-D-manno-octulosonic-acid transferase
MGFPLVLRLVRLWSRLPMSLAGRGGTLALPAPSDDDRDAVLIYLRDRRNPHLLTPVIERLADEDDGYRVVVAGGLGLGLPLSAERVTDPGGSAARHAALLKALKPVAAIILGDPFAIAAVDTATDLEVPLIVANVTLGASHRRFARLIRSSAQAQMQAYQHILTSDAQTYLWLRRLGISERVVERTGPLAELRKPPSYRPEERDALKMGLGARPVWCAVDVPDEELALVLQAMDLAARIAHRLLLVIMPRNPDRLDAVIEATKAAGHEPLIRSEGDDPDTETSVYIADIWEEQGLWFSLANVCYLGGTVNGPGAARSPMEPAALGCAVIHGAQSGAHSESFAMLLGAKASRLVTSAAELGEDVATLSSPDKQASMAAKAWQIETSTADIAERLHTLVGEMT